MYIIIQKHYNDKNIILFRLEILYIEKYFQKH